MGYFEILGYDFPEYRKRKGCCGGNSQISKDLTDLNKQAGVRRTELVR